MSTDQAEQYDDREGHHFGHSVEPHAQRGRVDVTGAVDGRDLARDLPLLGPRHGERCTSGEAWAEQPETERGDGETKCDRVEVASDGEQRHADDRERHAP